MGLQTMRSMWNPSFSATENQTSGGGGGGGGNPMLANKSALKDFLVSIASMTGDLSNTTAPPFVLDTKSVVEIPAFWAENPSVFISPTLSDDPIERALLVLKSFLAGMRSQCYMGHTEEEGVKKPLNAFLGELFMGHWEDEKIGTTYLVSEQVSHHPPITACRVWNPKYGVVAEGYNRQKVTFSMSSLQVHVGSTGFALKSLEKYDEHYLLPLPDFRVKGVLSGVPYPETAGDWYIPSTSGYMSKISFTGGKGFFGGGSKHGFSASLYKEGEEKHPLYTINGCWNTQFTIRDERAGKDLETFDVVQAVQNLPELILPPIHEMDAWESRRAWHDTTEAIKKNDFKATSSAKSFLEQGQRNMRKDEERNGTTWQPSFFKNGSSHAIVEKLMAKVPGHDFASTVESTKGVWVFDQDAYERNARGPFHSGLEPDNLREGEDRVYRNGSRGSFDTSRSSTPRGSVDFGRDSIDMSMFRNSIDSRTPRQSIDAGRPRQSIDSPRARQSISSTPLRPKVEENPGPMDNSRRPSANSSIVDVSQQPPRHEMNGTTRTEPGPHASQPRSQDEVLDSGVEGLNLKEKVAVEDMLRDTYSTR